MRALAQLTCTAALAVVFVASAVFPGTASAHSPNLHRRADEQKIYFFARPSSAVALVGQHLAIPNPRVVRPAGFPLFEDGQWVLEKLHWSGWGSPGGGAKGVGGWRHDE